jgi:hypothetical protein
VVKVDRKELVIVVEEELEGSLEEIGDGESSSKGIVCRGLIQGG